MLGSKNKGMEEILEDANIENYEDFPTPREIKNSYPLTEKAKQTVLESRRTIKNILDKKDKRKLILCGPCSIHSPEQSLKYVKNLKSLADEVSDVLYIVMRTYLEKPRTTIGWKGILYDPDLDNTQDLKKGIETSRQFLLDINELGVPCGNEFLRTDLPQYLADLISWAAIGARTTESQIHRELASGLSMPVGFKNNTSGDIKVAIDSCVTAEHPHKFPGINANGKITNIQTKGNKYCHVVLRGGNGEPNYYPEKLSETLELIKKAGLPENIVIDCSHANSYKTHEKQIQVAENVLNQITQGNNSITGIMLESNLNQGKQDFPKTPEQIQNLQYGVSITDACISWEQTQQLIRQYAERLRQNK